MAEFFRRDGALDRWLLTEHRGVRGIWIVMFVIGIMGFVIDGVVHG